MLRDAITSGALQPSQRLVEAELSETFGLSRAAVRTALVRLEQDGLVSHERHRGAKVRLVTEREAVEIVEARAALESLAVRTAALNATKGDVAELRALLREMRSLLKAGDLLRVSDVNARLHRRLLEISRNETAIRLTSTLNSQLVRFQFRTILAPGRGPQSLAEHTVWSSDLGQNFNPPVEDGLALMADRFLEAGFSEGDVRTMAVANTRRVAGLAAVPAAVGG